MAGFTARLLLSQIAGAAHNLSVMDPVRPMNGPAPSATQDFVRMGFSIPHDPDKAARWTSGFAQAVPLVMPYPEARTPRRPSLTSPAP